MLKRSSPARRAVRTVQFAFTNGWIRLNRRLPLSASYFMVRVISSGFWYRLSLTPVIGIIPRIVCTSVLDPDQAWRLINNFDGYVNTYSESWSEHELFPVLTRCGFVVKGLSEWRTGLWAEKVATRAPAAESAPSR